MCIQEAKREKKKKKMKLKIAKQIKSNIKGKRNAKGLHNLARWKFAKVAVWKSI